MKRFSLAAVAVAGLMLPSSHARACEAERFEEAIVHSALPAPLPRGTIIADVEFESEDVHGLMQEGVRVRVRRMIQGDYDGPTLIVRQRVWSSCSNPYANGTSGLIVGIPVETRAGELIVAPIEVARVRGYRLRGGFQFPEPAPGDVRLRL